MRGDDQAGLQVAWALLRRQVPLHTLHLLRAHPVPITTMLCDQIQAKLQETIRYCLQFPPPTADQWKIAELPITSEGLAFQNLHRQAVVARVSCLATLPEFVATQEHRGRHREGTS